MEAEGIPHLQQEETGEERDAFWRTNFMANWLQNSEQHGSSQSHAEELDYQGEVQPQLLWVDDPPNILPQPRSEVQATRLSILEELGRRQRSLRQTLAVRLNSWLDDLGEEIWGDCLHRRDHFHLWQKVPKCWLRPGMKLSLYKSWGPSISVIGAIS